MISPGRATGLGSFCSAGTITDSSGNTVDCSTWWNCLFNFSCGAAEFGISTAPAGSTPPDCSSFWKVVTNSQCTFGVPFALLAGGAVVAILLLKR